MRSIVLILAYWLLVSGCYTKKQALRKFCDVSADTIAMVRTDTFYKDRIVEREITPSGEVNAELPCDTVYKEIAGKQGPIRYRLVVKDGQAKLQFAWDSLLNEYMVLQQAVKSMQSDKKVITPEPKIIEVLPWWLKWLLWVISPLAIVGAIRVILFFSKRFSF